MSSPSNTPQRTCIASRKTGDKDTFLRFVKGPDGTVVFDVSGKAPGRGASVYPTAQCLEKAIKTKAFSRALDGAIVPENILENVRETLKKRLLQNLGLAKKANQLVIGADKVKEALDGLTYLFLASNAAENTRTAFAPTGVLRYTCLSKEDLEAALGVPNCTVVGIKIHGKKLVGEIAAKYESIINN